jgi:hypothetical protein
MANSVLVQIIQDGVRNSTVKITGELDTSDVAVYTVLDITTLNQSGNGQKPTKVRVMHIDYAIASGLEVVLDWHANTNIALLPIAGRGKMTYLSFGGLQNNAGAGVNGNIDLYTIGYTSGKMVFSVILELIKEGGTL